MSGAAIVAAGAGAEGFSSREIGVGAGLSMEGRVFGYFPVRVIPEVVFVVGEGNGDKGKLELLGEPVRWSGDSGEDFVIVGRGKF